ncbi:MAG: WD40 repeat domain-containing protein, partial [Nostoc sp.]
QFEELITLCKSEEREQFQELIKNSLAKYHNKIHVVITLRLDFEAQFQTSVLKEFWNGDARFVVPPMTQNELREVIEKPALEKVLYFDPPSLVDEIINEVVQMPGALPLLSFTLSELYLKYLGDRTRDNRALTKTDYEKLGRVVGSITKRANQEYDQLVKENPAYENTVRQVMLRMISLQGGELARRQVLKSELVYSSQDENNRVKTVIERFSQARLIVEGSNSEGEPYVEPAHDALVLGWVQLREWKGKDKENLDLQGRLTPAANDWNKDQGNLWTEEESRLSRLRSVINFEQNWLNKVETDFINKSIEEKRKRLAENEQQRDEALEGQISALTALSEARFQDDQLGALIHILKAARILQQLRNSESQWIQEDIRLRTEVVLRQILSKVKEFNRLEDKDIPLSMVEELSFTSNRAILLLDSQGRFVKLEFTTDQQLILMRDSQRIIRFWQSDGTLVERILPDFSPVKSSSDGQMIAHFVYRTSQSQQEPKANAIRLMNLEGKQVILQKDERDNLMTFAFSPNGQFIASGGWFGELYLWKTDGTTIQQKQTGAGSLNAIDFSPNGDKFATGSRNGEIRLWDQNGDLLRTIEAHRDAIWGVSFSPDGETLASVSTDTTVKIWKTNDGILLTTLNGHRDKVGAVCFNSVCVASPQGFDHILASASDEGTVRLWKPNGTKLKSLDDYHTGSIYAVRFNPKQPMIATTSGQGQLILWSQDGRLLKNWEKGHNGTITALDFSQNGRMFVTAAGDREVKLWRLDDDDKDQQNFRSHNLGNHTGESHLPTVFGVSFSSDNQTILLGSGSRNGKGYLELCDSESMSCRIIAEYDYQVLAVCFSLDGQMFALGKGDGSVELWRKEEDNFKLLRNFNQHDNLVIVVCFSPDGKFLATVSADKTVKLWQIDHILNNTNSITVTPTNIFSHTVQVTAVRFSPNGDLIATASYDKTVKLWNLDGTLKKTLHGHNDQVNALDFSPDGQIIASGSNDKTVILWDLKLELGLDQLIDYGCEWISDYLTNNPNVSESDRQLLSLENFPNLKYDSQKWI